MEWNEGTEGLVQAVRRARWRWIAMAWGAIFTFEASRHCIDAYVAGRSPSGLWLTVCAMTLTLWMASTPFLLWLGRRVPFDRCDRARSVATHVVALLALVAIDAAMQAWMWGNQGRSTFRSLFFGLMIIDGFSYATVVAISQVQRSNERYRERVRAQAALDRELTTARLRALEMQLQPHFLFNTLHAVGALVRSARADDALRSLAALGGLLRATLAADDAHEIALDDEIALARRYLALQKIRFGDRLHVEIAIAPEMKRAQVPRLILQPLLENAIRHGVERSRTAVAVQVCAVARGDRLELTVADRGGMRETPSPGKGIGLANTRARLATLYGEAHSLELTSTSGGGFALRIEIPLVFAPARASAPRELEVEGDLAGELEVAT
jgi:two-component system, LytTR family, sensor kinase